MSRLSVLSTRTTAGVPWFVPSGVGVVLSGHLAGMFALAGGYAFYTVFQPKGNAMEETFDLTTLILSMVFGLFWGLMIFNLDRFIVASTGKGDSTERIRRQEFFGALPRIFMRMIGRNTRN